MKEQVGVDEHKCLYCKKAYKHIELLNYHITYRCLKADYARLKRLEENIKDKKEELKHEFESLRVMSHSEDTQFSYQPRMQQIKLLESLDK